MDDQAPALLSAGGVFHGKYEVRRCLKVGGMAIVYEVVHCVTRRPSALKVMLPEILSERGMRARFEQEARITAGIASDHIAEVLDAGVDEATGSPFLVMELLRGDDLESVLRQRGPLMGGEVVSLLAQVAPALDAVHEANIVHRDLKPSNLFLVEADGQPPRLKVLDFGIAKIVAAGALTTRNLGTPVYMSPEQAAGDADIGPAADLYSLGQIAYTLLVGAPYWAEEGAAGGRLLFDKVEEGATEPATRRAEMHGVRLPAAFDAWFARATAVEPEDRFATTAAMVADLASVLGVPPPILGVETKRARSRPARQWSARSTVLSVVAVGVLGAAWVGVRAMAASGRAREASTAPNAASRALAPAEIESPTAAPPVSTGLPRSPAPATASARSVTTWSPRAPSRPTASALASVAPVASPSPFGTAVY